MAEIIGDYKDGLTLYLNSFVGNIYIAEELMEETFVKLATKKPRFSGKSTFKTWLYSIGKNTASDYVRKNSKASEVPLEKLENMISDEEDLLRNYIKKEDGRAVRSALSRLPKDYRSAVYLAFFEGFSNEETARITGKSKRQVENLIYRGKLRLKEELIKEGFIYEE